MSNSAKGSLRNSVSLSYALSANREIGVSTSKAIYGSVRLSHFELVFNASCTVTVTRSFLDRSENFKVPLAPSTEAYT